MQAAEERSLRRLVVTTLLALALGELPRSDALFQRNKAPAGPQPHLPVAEYQVSQAELLQIHCAGAERQRC